MSGENKKYKTIIISDIHLGSTWSNINKVIYFLKNNICETLILNGDIIDGWHLATRKKKKWNDDYNNFFQTLLNLTKSTKIIYVRGNHDDFVSKLASLKLPNISFVEDYIYKSFGKTYKVLHGDCFDSFAARIKLVARWGDISYHMSLRVTYWINNSRMKNNKPLSDLSKRMKHKVKVWVNKMSGFEKKIKKLANSEHYDGVICGHVHNPEIRNYGGVIYMNSGDWVESMSALVENCDGKWEILSFLD